MASQISSPCGQGAIREGVLLGSLYNAIVVTVVLVVVQVDGCISWLYLLTRA